MPPKRVTLLVNSLRGGGTEGVCVTLANGLARAGWQVDLVVLSLERAVRTEDLCSAVRLLSLDCRRSLTALPALYRYCVAASPAVFLCFNPQLAVLLVMLRVLGKRHTVVVRGQNNMSAKRSREASFWHRHVSHALFRIFYGRCNYFVAQSAGMAQDMIVSYGVPSDRLQVIHNPLSAEFGALPGITAARHPAPERYVLCVGRLVEQKGFDQAIEVFARLAADFPLLRLIIAGEGPLRGELRQLAEAKGLGERVDFPGYRTDLPLLMRDAACLWLTSWYEGFPNVMVEALASGLPIVAYDCPSGPREIVTDGINGYVVPLGDLTAFECRAREALHRTWSVGDIVASSRPYWADTILAKYEELLERVS